MDDQEAEWNAVCDELIAASGGGPVTAQQVTAELRRRRGEQPEEMEVVS